MRQKAHDIKIYSQLLQIERQQLEQLVEAEFGHIDFVSQISWAQADYSVRKLEDDQLVCFYNIVKRTVSIDGEKQIAMGISNVITPSEHRGKRYAFELLKSTQEQMLKKIGASLGLLLCAEAMVPFYRRLGWKVVDCPVYYTQRDSITLWQAKTMLLIPNKEIGEPREIHLNGNPW